MEAADAKAVTAPSKKRLVVFIDGTWNVEDNNTNVWRLYSLCRPDPLQKCFYTKGVGTSYGSKFRGGILGMGFTDIVRQAYDWLIANYEKDDDIFIFGFSRGSYAARSLAGLVARCGIPLSGSPIGVDEIYDRYKGGSTQKTIRDLLKAIDDGEAGGFTLFEKWMVEHCVTADILMVGVWETVGALIGNYSYLETGLRLPIKHIFHALAIDENRLSFAPTLLTRNIHANRPLEPRSEPRHLDSVEQRWFVGAHANVGGGYASDPLNQRPLVWILNKATGLGLTVAAPVVEDPKPWMFPVKDSLWEFGCHLYWTVTLGIRYFRPIGRSDVVKGPLTTETVNETIDGSVFERWRQVEYRPRNLRKWASVHKIDPAQITSSVMAKNPMAPVPD